MGTVTETPARGMNSRFAWTVLQGNDEFLRRGTRSTPTGRGGLRCASRATVSIGFAPAEADRLIGVWCVPPTIPLASRNRNLKNARTIDSPFGPESLRRLPLQPPSDSFRAWINVHSRVHEREKSESQKINGTRNVRSLDFRGHIGVSPKRPNAGG